MYMWIFFSPLEEYAVGLMSSFRRRRSWGERKINPSLQGQLGQGIRRLTVWGSLGELPGWLPGRAMYIPGRVVMHKHMHACRQAVAGLRMWHSFASNECLKTGRPTTQATPTPYTTLGLIQQPTRTHHLVVINS